ncbi:MAG: hypothetical protein U9N87_05795 [Planctomycetota bacterium]|nr:hypothetical protein [Planctomycetota bacterium]
MKIISTICVSLGIILMVSAFVYPRTVNTESLWSEEQAIERMEAGYAIHGMSHDHGHGQTSHSKKREDSTLDRYKKIQADLDEARERPWRIASMLKWLGMAATGLGVGLYYLARGNE